MDTLKKLKTLQEAIVYFANPDNCVAYMVSKRWKDGVICPNCGSREVKYMESRRVWQCKTRHPKSQFSVKVGSVYEDSAIGLDKWLTATWMVTNCKNGVSSYEVSRSIGVTQKSAWFMLHRIRTAMEDDGASKLGHNGPVEIDETFVGGKVKNIHKSKRRLPFLHRFRKVYMKQNFDRIAVGLRPSGVWATGQIWARRSVDGGGLS